MSLKPVSMLLVDLDGTMVDSVPDLAYCIDQMMVELGRQPCGELQVRNWVGNGAERLVRRALVGQIDGEPDQELFDRAMPIFLRHYQDNICIRSHLYGGVKKSLVNLAQAGYRLGCVTNKPAQFTEPLLKQLGIFELFRIVVSGDTLPEKKPDPAPLLYAARQLDVTAEQCLMVGDSVNDVKAARSAGFQVICVSYGYNHGLDIRDAQPDAVIDNFSELANLLRAKHTKRAV